MSRTAECRVWEEDGRYYFEVTATLRGFSNEMFTATHTGFGMGCEVATLACKDFCRQLNLVAVFEKESEGA